MAELTDANDHSFTIAFEDDPFHTTTPLNLGALRHSSQPSRVVARSTLHRRRHPPPPLGASMGSNTDNEDGPAAPFRASKERSSTSSEAHRPYVRRNRKSRSYRSSWQLAYCRALKAVSSDRETDTKTQTLVYTVIIVNAGGSWADHWWQLTAWHCAHRPLQHMRTSMPLYPAHS